jgi:molecular chaperone HtpG
VKIQRGNKINRGTRISLYLKDDQLEYLEDSRFKELVKKHSEFITYPIKLQIKKTLEKVVEEEDDFTSKSQRSNQR